jgi:hypothetical protein
MLANHHHLRLNYCKNVPEEIALLGKGLVGSVLPYRNQRERSGHDINWEGHGGRIRSNLSEQMYADLSRSVIYEISFFLKSFGSFCTYEVVSGKLHLPLYMLSFAIVYLLVWIFVSYVSSSPTYCSSSMTKSPSQMVSLSLCL